MENLNAYQTYPKGAKKLELALAELASNKSSVDLVSDQESDAFYFRSLEATGMQLNQSQIDAVRHYQGSALVLAGAGSGKTRVLTSRTGYLISVHNVNPKNILLVTFTKKAAEEMKDRIAKLPGLSKQMVNGITAGTFHSIFYRLLKSQGYNQQILSSEKQKQIAIKMILKQRKLQDLYEPETLLAILSSHKNNMKTVQDIQAENSLEKEIKAVLTEYESWKQQKQLLDFDDMLLEAYKLLKTDERLLTAMQKRFQYLLCDEWQDTNRIQYELIKMIAKPSNHLFVVGDDDQTIFSFNGADSSIILRFSDDFPEVKKITLDINYRSTSHIVSLSNNVIKNNELRHKKTLKTSKDPDQKPIYLSPDTTDDEAKWLVEKIIKDVQFGKRKYSDIAILHRTATNSRAIFDQMVLKKIPFITYTKGETFYEHGIVKPVLDYLRLSLNPQNKIALENILPSMYLNRENTIKYIETEEMFTPEKKLVNYLLRLPHLKDYQKKQINQRMKMIDKLHELSPTSAIKEVRSFYDKYLEANDRKTLTTDKEMMKETLSELLTSAKKFSSVKEYIQFIDEINYKHNQMFNQRNKMENDVISLMTIHRAKGLEYPVIYLIGASETILPHSSALEADERKDLLIAGEGKKKIECAVEEERRLMYVAITRAKEEIIISSPSLYRGRKVAVSRFIMEAYGVDKVTRSHEEMNKTSKKRKSNPINREFKLVNALVWECTSSRCNGWKQVNKNEKETLDPKVCPLCKGVMEKKEREVKKYS
ncbi:UvrD-helicase domain-containing protein [Salipaludibacillus daqingensis]|uniref:UvrD-helicase domain-containing protein n=1 Tax=Salipaludibacillus daqingensis TaxID=3041001 RepID=UPI002474FDB3|nr:UvrD-helicase domain-containing protein [Salipaludibacillus daqingensis]